jgi:hypothetical protein
MTIKGILLVHQQSLLWAIEILNNNQPRVLDYASSRPRYRQLQHSLVVDRGKCREHQRQIMYALYEQPR